MGTTNLDVRYDNYELLPLGCGLSSASALKTLVDPFIPVNLLVDPQTLPEQDDLSSHRKP